MSALGKALSKQELWNELERIQAELEAVRRLTGNPMTYVLVGQYCPTDANPEKDIPPDQPWQAFTFPTREAAEAWPDRFWYPPMIVAEVTEA